MTSDEERRRAVAELREASTGAYRRVDALDVIAGSVGVDAEGKFDYEIENETYTALADFIDPTCEYVPIGGERFGCSECGNTVRLDFDVPVTDETPMPFKHCPNCGARVVRGDE